MGWLRNLLRRHADAPCEQPCCRNVEAVVAQKAATSEQRRSALAELRGELARARPSGTVHELRRRANGHAE